MADELTPEMLQEAQPDLLTLEDEDGKECTFEVIDATEVNGTRYLAVIPYQEDPESLDEEAELILMRIGTDEAGEYMDIVDDDEELLTVGKVFEERLRAMYDIDDDDVEGQPFGSPDLSPAGSQTSRPVYTRQAEEGSVIAGAGHPPAI